MKYVLTGSELDSGLPKITAPKAVYGAWLAWNVIGLILVGPILYALAQASLGMAVWVVFCIGAGLALAAWAPLAIWKKFKG